MEESEILGKQIFELTIQATKTGTVNGFTALVITIEPEECIEVTEILIFEKSLYTQSFSWTDGLTIPSITLISTSYQTDVIFELEGGMSIENTIAQLKYQNFIIKNLFGLDCFCLKSLIFFYILKLTIFKYDLYR